MAEEKKIGFETPEARERRLVREETKEALKALEKRLGRLESKVETTESRLTTLTLLGRYKRIHCTHNIGGICRQWRWDEEVSVPGVELTKLGETGKFHPEPNDDFCASCNAFVAAP